MPTQAARPTIKLYLADAPDEAVGQIIGRYKLLEKIGEGGCGAVNVPQLHLEPFVSTDSPIIRSTCQPEPKNDHSLRIGLVAYHRP